jgi:hypothetical protein
MTKDFVRLPGGVVPYILSAVGAIAALFVYLSVTGLVVSSSASAALISLLNDRSRSGIFVLTAIEIGIAALLGIVVAWALLHYIRRSWPESGLAPSLLYGALTIAMWLYWSMTVNSEHTATLQRVGGASSLLFDLATSLPIVALPIVLVLWSTRRRPMK